MPPVTFEISSEVFFLSFNLASLCAATIKSSKISFGSLWEVSLKVIFFNYEYPKPENIHSEQKNYIQNYIHDFEEVLASLLYIYFPNFAVQDWFYSL